MINKIDLALKLKLNSHNDLRQKERARVKSEEGRGRDKRGRIIERISKKKRKRDCEIDDKE